MQKRPSYDVVKELYVSWLRGKTLRQIAREYPEKVSHSTICIWFNKTMGEGASNPQQLSLLRSLLEDNPDNPDVEEWVLANIHNRSQLNHRSKHSIGQLSRYQTVHDPQLLEYMAPTGNDPWDTVEQRSLDYLRLPLYLLLVEVITEALKEYAGRMGTTEDQDGGVQRRSPSRPA